MTSATATTKENLVSAITSRLRSGVVYRHCDTDGYHDEVAFRDGRYVHVDGFRAVSNTPTYLADASLAAMGPSHPAWRETAWNHVGLAPKLHKGRRFIIVEHQDCGAYKKLLEPQSLRAHVGAARGAKDWTNAKAEAKLHWLVASAMKKAVAELLPDWQVDILYAALENTSSLHAKVRPFTEEEKAFKLDADPVTVAPKREWLG